MPQFVTSAPYGFSTPQKVILWGSMHLNTREEMETTVISQFLDRSRVPDLIGVELNQKRFEMFSKSRDLSESLRENAIARFDPELVQLKKSSFLGNLAGGAAAFVGGAFQYTLAKLRGVKPGEDMAYGCSLADQPGKQLYLIDKDIRSIVPRLGQAIVDDCKDLAWRFFFGAQYLADRKQKSEPRRRQAHPIFRTEEARKQYEIIKKLGSHPFMREGTHKHGFMVEERNQFMANNAVEILRSSESDSILLIVGAAHVPGMVDLLHDYPNLRVEVMFSHGLDQYLSMIND